MKPIKILVLKVNFGSRKYNTENPFKAEKCKFCLGFSKTNTVEPQLPGR